LPKSDDSKKRLMDVIQHDVRRLDRLISDISDASRLDAELPASMQVRSIWKCCSRSGRYFACRSAAARRRSRSSSSIERKPRQGALRRQRPRSAHRPDHHQPDRERPLLRSGPGRRITVRLVRTGKRCIVTVEDNGPGIQAENIDRIFERFYTDRPERRGFGQNSGLGLSISRQIAEAHGGSLKAENITDAETGKGAGARFILSLPVDSSMTGRRSTSMRPRS
jgi:two-component system sensor histidine kinase ChvG